MNGLRADIDVAQLITLVAAIIAALTSVLAVLLTVLSERGSKRRDWSRAELAKTYSEIIRSSRLAEEILINWEGEEGTADESDPAAAPHYAWDDEGQAHLEDANRRITFALADLEMFAPRYVVEAAKSLHSHIWLAESYHRLAHLDKILEVDPVENRRISVAKAILGFVSAVRRDLGV